MSYPIDTYVFTIDDKCNVTPLLNTKTDSKCNSNTQQVKQERSTSSVQNPFHTLLKMTLNPTESESLSKSLGPLADIITEAFNTIYPPEQPTSTSTEQKNNTVTPQSAEHKPTAPELAKVPSAEHKPTVTGPAKVPSAAIETACTGNNSTLYVKHATDICKLRNRVLQREGGKEYVHKLDEEEQEELIRLLLKKQKALNDFLEQSKVSTSLYSIVNNVKPTAVMPQNAKNMLCETLGVKYGFLNFDYNVKMTHAQFETCKADVEKWLVKHSDMYVVM